MRRWPLALACLLGACSPAGAESASILEPVPGHPEMRWFDLLASVVPGLQLEGDRAVGEAVVDIPHIAGEGYLNDAGPTSFDLRSVSFEMIEAEGRERLLVLASLGGTEFDVAGTEVLALFEADLTYLDAVQVGFDRFTGFREPPAVRIGPDDEAVMVDSSHFNSSQNYSNSTLLFVRDGKLQLVDTVFTFGDRGCNFAQQQTLSVIADENGEGEYWPITAKVVEIRTVSNECEEAETVDPPFSRAVSVTYTWSTSLGGYVADSEALAELAQQTSERF